MGAYRCSDNRYSDTRYSDSRAVGLGLISEDEAWYGGRPRPGDIVLDGDPAPPKGHRPQFSAHVCCGHTPGWTKMPLRTEVGLGPGDILLHGDPARPPPNFRFMSVVAKRSPISATAELL